MLSLSLSISFCACQSQQAARSPGVASYLSCIEPGRYRPRAAEERARSRPLPSADSTCRAPRRERTREARISPSIQAFQAKGAVPFPPRPRDAGATFPICSSRSSQRHMRPAETDNSSTGGRGQPRADFGDRFAAAEHCATRSPVLCSICPRFLTASKG